VNAQIAASERQQKLASERAEALSLAQKSLQEAKDPNFLAKLSDPELAGYVALEQGRQDRIGIIFADLGLPKQDSQASMASVASKVAAELTCRADTQCMAARQAKALASRMCSNIAMIRNMQERIRVERANPSGVVDLAELHDDGDIIQRNQAELAQAKAQYLTLTHKAFEGGVAVTQCQEVQRERDAVQAARAQEAAANHAAR
jgi:hypothetical protein